MYLFIHNSQVYWDKPMKKAQTNRGCPTNIHWHSHQATGLARSNLGGVDRIWTSSWIRGRNRILPWQDWKCPVSNQYEAREGDFLLILLRKSVYWICGAGSCESISRYAGCCRSPVIGANCLGTYSRYLSVRQRRGTYGGWPSCPWTRHKTWRRGRWNSIRAS